jgi:DNA transformation protein
METALIDAGIANAETLREVGANAAYCNLLENGQRPHFIEYYVMHMALQGRPWNGWEGAEKDALRMTFDALCAKYVYAARSELESFMNRIGVRK